jgi:hypothetical protein
MACLQPHELLARGFARFPLGVTVSRHNLFAEGREERAAASCATRTCRGHGFRESAIQIVEQ